MVRALPGGPSILPRLTPRERDVDEVRLAKASALGRSVSAERVAAALGGFRLDTEMQACDTSSASVLSIPPDTVTALDWRSAVDRAALGANPATTEFEMADGTGRGALAAWPLAVREHGSDRVGSVRPFGLIKALKTGATGILNDISHADDGPLGRLETDLTRVAGCSVQTNVYLSEREATGFGRHWDDHEVIIVQCHGRKLWEVHEPITLAPVRPLTSRDEGGPVVWSGVLEPGLGLYIPRGWAHAVKGFADQFSAHYTIGFTRPCGIDVLAAMPEVLSSHGDRLDASAAIEALPTAIDLVQARSRGTARARRCHGPMTALLSLDGDFASTLLEAPLPGGAVFLDGDVQPNEIGMLAHRIPFAFDRSLVPAIARLLEAEPFTITDLADETGIPVDDLTTTIRQLAEWDLVRLAQ